VNSKEFRILVKEIERLKSDIRNLLTVLLDLKVIKVKIDENGNASYDTGKDEQPEVQ